LLSSKNKGLDITTKVDVVLFSRPNCKIIIILIVVRSFLVIEDIRENESSIGIEKTREVGRQRRQSHGNQASVGKREGSIVGGR
jgi:hypothetical protein